MARTDRWQSIESFSIPQTPLIDIIFILIVFFLVATTFYSEERDMKVELPEGDQGTVIEREQERLVVNIRPGGVITIRNNLVSLLQLEQEFQRASGTDDAFVEIRGDSTVRHGRIMEVMNLCRKCGVRRYSLTQRIVTEQE